MANDTPRDMPAGPDKLADDALARLCDEMAFGPIEREFLARILRGLARDVALETAVRIATDARCSSAAAEEGAESRQAARHAERQAWLAGCPGDRLHGAPGRGGEG
jgi:hypothetical protein